MLLRRTSTNNGNHTSAVLARQGAEVRRTRGDAIARALQLAQTGLIGDRPDRRERTRHIDGEQAGVETEYVNGLQEEEGVAEAAGVEPARPQDANRLMVRDFRRNS